MRLKEGCINAVKAVIAQSSRGATIACLAQVVLARAAGEEPKVPTMGHEQWGERNSGPSPLCSTRGRGQTARMGTSTAHRQQSRGFGALRGELHWLIVVTPFLLAVALAVTTFKASGSAAWLKGAGVRVLLSIGYAFRYSIRRTSDYEPLSHGRQQAMVPRDEGVESIPTRSPGTTPRR